MNVTFIYPDFLSFDPSYSGAFHEGIGSLSAVLTNHGHRSSLIHIVESRGYRKENFLSDISRTSPDIIGFSSSTITFPFVRKILNSDPRIRAKNYHDSVGACVASSTSLSLVSG